MIDLNPELLAKTKILKDSKFFSDNPYDGAMYAKRDIFLVLAGKKPLSEATSGHWEATETGRQALPEDHEELGKFLSELGLEYSLSSDEHGTNALVSLDKSLIAEFLKEETHNTGKIFGYPDTAVQAFIDGTCLDFTEQDNALADAGVPEFIVNFRLSKAHYKEEIEEIKSWHELVTAYGFLEPEE